MTTDIGADSILGDGNDRPHDQKVSPPQEFCYVIFWNSKMSQFCI